MRSPFTGSRAITAFAAGRPFASSRSTAIEEARALPHTRVMAARRLRMRVARMFAGYAQLVNASLAQCKTSAAYAVQRACNDGFLDRGRPGIKERCRRVAN